MASRMGVAVMAVLLALAASVRAQSTPNAQINLDMEVYGSTIQPFNSTKASTIGQGIANLLADGTQASQISIQDQGALAASASGGTGLGNGQPGVNLGVTIQTLQSRAQQEIDTIYNSLFNGKLQTQWGQLSLQITGVNVTRNSTSGLTGEAVPFGQGPAPSAGLLTAPAPAPARSNATQAAPAPSPSRSNATGAAPAPGPAPLQAPPPVPSPAFSLNTVAFNLTLGSLSNQSFGNPLGQDDLNRIQQSILAIIGPMNYSAADITIGQVSSSGAGHAQPAGRRLRQQQQQAVSPLVLAQVLVRALPGNAANVTTALTDAASNGRLQQTFSDNGLAFQQLTVVPTPGLPALAPAANLTAPALAPSSALEAPAPAPLSLAAAAPAPAPLLAARAPAPAPLAAAQAPAPAPLLLGGGVLAVPAPAPLPATVPAPAPLQAPAPAPLQAPAPAPLLAPAPAPAAVFLPGLLDLLRAPAPAPAAFFLQAPAPAPSTSVAAVPAPAPMQGLAALPAPAPQPAAQPLLGVLPGLLSTAPAPQPVSQPELQAPAPAPVPEGAALASPAFQPPAPQPAPRQLAAGTVPAPAPQQGAPTPAPPPAATAPAPAPLQTQFPPAPGPSPVQLTANLILADANLSLPLSQADEQNIIQSVLQVLPPGYTAADLSLGSAQSLAQAASAPAFSTSSQAGRRLLQSGSSTQVQVLINSASGDAQQAQNAIQTAVNNGQLSQALQANGVPVSGVTTTSSNQTPTQDLQTSGVNISQGNIGNPTPTPAPASPSPTPASPSPSPAAATSPSPAAATSPSPASASPPSSSRALSSSGGGGGFPTWAVAPIVVGALICLALVGVLLFCCVWRPRKQRKKQEADYVQKYFENVNKGEPYPNNAAPAAAAGGAGAGGLAGLQQQLRSDSMSSTNSMTRNPMLLPVGPGGLTRTNSGLLRTPSGQLLRTNSGSFANPVAGGGGGGPGSVVSDRSGVSRTPSGQLRSASWQQPPLQRTNSGTSGNGVVRSTSGTGAGAATGAGAGAGASMNRANSFGAVPRSVSASDGSAGGLIGPRDAANPLAQGNGSVLPVRQRSTSPGQRRPGRTQDTNALTGLTTKPNWVRGKVGKPNLDVLDTQ